MKRSYALYISANSSYKHSVQYSGMMKHGQQYIGEQVTNIIMRCNTKKKQLKVFNQTRSIYQMETINLYEQKVKK